MKKKCPNCNSSRLVGTEHKYRCAKCGYIHDIFRKPTISFDRVTEDSLKRGERDL